MRDVESSPITGFHERQSGTFELENGVPVVLMGPHHGSFLDFVCAKLISFLLGVVAMFSARDCEPRHDGGLVGRRQFVEENCGKLNGNRELDPVAKVLTICLERAFADGGEFPCINRGREGSLDFVVHEICRERR